MNRTACDDGDPCTLDICDSNMTTGSLCLFPPLCDDGLFCTDDYCTAGVCSNPDKVCNLPMTKDEMSCFYQRCNENLTRCEKVPQKNAILSVCGSCLDVTANSSDLNATSKTACIAGLEWPKFVGVLSAAAVVGIIIAVIAGIIIIGVSSFFGTKELVRRARLAQNQAPVSNPLYKPSDNEMVNPTFTE
jgi:hypothetical protein